MLDFKKLTEVDEIEKVLDNDTVVVERGGKLYRINVTELTPKELPEVTEEDEGKVLGVVDGAWGKTAPQSGGCGAMVVEFTVGDDDASVFSVTADKTPAEVAEAMLSQIVIGVVSDLTGDLPRHFGLGSAFSNIETGMPGFIKYGDAYWITTDEDGNWKLDL